MTDNSIRKMITHTIDTLPVPWEQLWVIFRRVIQLMRDPQKAIEEKTENQNESKKVIEEENERRRKGLCSVQNAEVKLKKKVRCFVQTVDKDFRWERKWCHLYLPRKII